MRPRARGAALSFGISASGSTISREVIAGFTTFGAMSYIVVVNPAILSATGANVHDLITVTALAAMVGTLIMALFARLPIALAPGMGSNIVFAQVVVVRMGLSYGTALTMVLIGALIFVCLSLTRFRDRLVQGFPEAIRLGLQCGIGLFIAYLGLKNGGIVMHDAHGGVSFASLRHPAILVVFLGMLFTPVLLALRIPGALLLSIVAVSIIGLFVPAGAGRMMTPYPTHIVSLPSIPRSLLFAFDVRQFTSHVFLVLPITLYFFLSDFFSATATLIGVTRRGGMMDADGRIPNARRAYLADGIASVIGAMLGSPTVVAYVESAAGVESGGRTGLTAVVVAALFGASLFFWPLIAIVPAQATAPALVIVGVLMMEGIRDLGRERPEDAIATILILLVTVTTTDLMMGLSTGCLAYTLIVLATRAWDRITPMLLCIDIILIGYVVLVTETFRSG
ncbi:NCS2 family permease [Lichenicoccus sp.]|uniref:NCS2 family permease n=1 Tax=Lichenicoccus sp. TaxID=2781899 RepID=UPI003D13538E